ncbi:GAF and ANTAR domain-containing protein [Georgenia subflava]|uniref:GAF and ANTAR domain-containing protein n=1 Tax=Georgenia subflava TaxID=1622177 RepID=UPI00186B05FD|nr:GAF and ANTAR domain-containing protein [Georgenia subflava]
MYDHQLFVQTISEFVRTLVRPYDVDTVLNDLAGRLNAVLTITGSGVSLAEEGRIRMVTVIPPELAALEHHEDETQEGPGAAAYRSGKLVAVNDLREVADRWPGYCRVARESGIAATAAIPLALDGDVYGVLSLYSAPPREWPQDDLAAAAVLADIATGYLINASTHHQQEQLNEQLRQALDTRVIIEQAKGVIAEAYTVSVDEAFERIRRHARRHNAKIRDVAEAVVKVGMRL